MNHAERNWSPLIKRLVDEAPVLTIEQRMRLGPMLRAKLNDHPRPDPRDRCSECGRWTWCGLPDEPRPAGCDADETGRRVIKKDNDGE